MSRKSAYLNMTWDEWLAAVDAFVEKKVGCSYHDLPDMSYRDWYDDGMTPARAGQIAIRSAKEEYGHDY